MKAITQKACKRIQALSQKQYHTKKKSLWVATKIYWDHHHNAELTNPVEKVDKDKWSRSLISANKMQSEEKRGAAVLVAEGMELHLGILTQWFARTHSEAHGILQMKKEKQMTSYFLSLESVTQGGDPVVKGEATPRNHRLRVRIFAPESLDILPGDGQVILVHCATAIGDHRYAEAQFQSVLPGEACERGKCLSWLTYRGPEIHRKVHVYRHTCTVEPHYAAILRIGQKRPL